MLSFYILNKNNYANSSNEKTGLIRNDRKRRKQWNWRNIVKKLIKKRLEQDNKKLCLWKKYLDKKKVTINTSVSDLFNQVYNNM